MILTSLTFLFFSIIVILIYFIVPKRIQWIVLLASSLTFLFYNSLTVSNIISVLIVLISAYFGAILIQKYENTKKSKIFLILTILFILGELALLKYSNLFIVTINHINNLFNINKQFNMVSFSSPIGLSYYALIMIGYVIDVYRGICKPQKNILKCALFMSYFPILTSGPFIRYDKMEDELYTKHKFSYDNLCKGLVRILWGVFKILVISQRLSLFVNTVYGDINTFNGFFIVIAAMFFTLQLYTNFSGSIDIIMGVSKIMGINLPENFTSPFFSKTITEFWRNWHITLGAWLKDYVFYPLMKSNFIQNIGNFFKKLFGKKVSKKVTLYLSMLIMWILIGIWHGGAYTYIIGSGILQFIYIFLEDLLGPIVHKINEKIGIKEDVFSYKLYQCIRTFLLFSFAMIFFRATSVSNGVDIIKHIFVYNPWVLFDNSSIYTAGLDLIDFRILIISLVVLFIVEYLQRKGSVTDMLFNQNIVFRWLVLYLLIFAIIIFGMYGPGYDPTVFIYRGF